jgi:hypothetical protein
MDFLCVLSLSVHPIETSFRPEGENVAMFVFVFVLRLCFRRRREYHAC